MLIGVCSTYFPFMILEPCHLGSWATSERNRSFIVLLFFCRGVRAFFDDRLLNLDWLDILVFGKGESVRRRGKIFSLLGPEWTRSKQKTWPGRRDQASCCVSEWWKSYVVNELSVNVSGRTNPVLCHQMSPYVISLNGRRLIARQKLVNVLLYAHPFETLQVFWLVTTNLWVTPHQILSEKHKLLIKTMNN